MIKVSAILPQLIVGALGEAASDLHITKKTEGITIMKVLLPALLLASGLVTACSSVNTPALEPIPGSINYGGQPHSKLTKSPIGSAVYNDFYDQSGQHVYETYILQPDRSLKLTRRQVVPDFPQ